MNFSLFFLFVSSIISLLSGRRFLVAPGYSEHMERTGKSGRWSPDSPGHGPTQQDNRALWDSGLPLQSVLFISALRPRIRHFCLRPVAFCFLPITLLGFKKKKLQKYSFTKSSVIRITVWNFKKSTAEKRN